MNCGIYKITNLSNGKIYIGSSFDLDKRWREHKSNLSRKSHHNKHLQNSWNKYGEVSFSFEVLEYCQVDVLLIREQFFIDNYLPEYNLCKVSGSRLGVKLSPEAKERMSAAQKLVCFIKSKTHKGKVLSSETKQKISNSLSGRKISEETRNKMSNSRIGHKTSTETKEKLSIAVKRQWENRK